MSADDEQEISIHPAPGTCCPEQKVVDGICKGCGHVHDERKALAAKKSHLRDLVVIQDCLVCGNLRTLAVCAADKMGQRTGDFLSWHPCPSCVQCCETCDWWTEFDDKLTGHCLPNDLDTEYEYCCDQFKKRDG